MRKNFMVKMDEETLKYFKIWCKKNGRFINFQVEKILTEWIHEQVKNDLDLKIIKEKE